MYLLLYSWTSGRSTRKFRRSLMLEWSFLIITFRSPLSEQQSVSNNFFYRNGFLVLLSYTFWRFDVDMWTKNWERRRYFNTWPTLGQHYRSPFRYIKISFRYIFQLFSVLSLLAHSQFISFGVNLNKQSHRSLFQHFVFLANLSDEISVTHQATLTQVTPQARTLSLKSLKKNQLENLRTFI